MFCQLLGYIGHRFVRDGIELELVGVGSHGHGLRNTVSCSIESADPTMYCILEGCGGGKIRDT